MEVKKKFEKPQMEVLKLKPAGIMSGSDCPQFGQCNCDDYCGSDCPLYGQCSCDNDCPWDGDW